MVRIEVPFLAYECPVVIQQILIWTQINMNSLCLLRISWDAVKERHAET